MHFRPALKDLYGIFADIFADILICSVSEEMIEDMMKPEFREYMKELSGDKYGVDLDKKKQSIPTVASFRKLNID